MLRQLDTDIYAIDTPYSKLGFEIGARCVIVRLPDGSLWVHSPVEVTPALYAEVEALGEVRHLVSPSAAHYLDLKFWAERYPKAKVYGVENLKEIPGVTINKRLQHEAEPEWASVLDQTLFEGSILTVEAVFCHRPSRTLILTDTAFNISRRQRGWSRVLARLLDILGKLTPSRAFKASIRDKAAAKRSVETIFGWDFKRVTVAHGEIYEGDGKGALRRAYAFLWQ